MLLVTKHMGVFPAARGSLRHRPHVLQFDSILTLSTWRERQTPQVKGSVPRDSPDSRPIASSRSPGYA